MSDTATTTPTKLDAWKGAKQHTVTLPSGTQVDIVLPNLPKMLQTGEVPNPLVQQAVEAAQGRVNIDEDAIRAQFDFYKFLVSVTVVDPKIAPDDVKDLPFEDIEMLVAFASRDRDVDALGHQLAGLERHAAWRRFRGIDGGDSPGSRL